VESHVHASPAATHEMTPTKTLCPECPKFYADWMDAVLDFSRRNAVYAASAITTDSDKKDEETARIEGARLRTDAALAALRYHRQSHPREYASEAGAGT
jgi:hypothetical protein